jgi:3-oxoacyl-[acyl-carrier-protein] synthase II
MAYEFIKSGAQDLMIAGGAEELHPTHAGVFDLMFAASHKYNADPERTPRPFDRGRDGVVVGEGATTFVLERRDHALRRGAEIHGEIVGYATTCDGIHLTNPSWKGMAACMAAGLKSAGISADRLDYVNAHGTGTELGDIAESRATAEVVGCEVPVSTQKSYVGHTLGACGAMETAFTLLMMRDGFLAPNRTLDEVDPRCASLDYVVGDPRDLRAKRVMCNNFAFGGINTTLILERA